MKERISVRWVLIDIPQGAMMKKRWVAIYLHLLFRNLKEGAKDVVISSVGDNLYSVSRIMASRSNKEFFLGHLRTVVVGVDIAKNPADFRHILDGIENNEF